jgi:hypothetical protein
VKVTKTKAMRFAHYGVELFAPRASLENSKAKLVRGARFYNFAHAQIKTVNPAFSFPAD